MSDLRRRSRRLTAVLAIALAGAGTLLILLSTGTFASGDNSGQPPQANRSPNAPNPHDITAQGAADAVVSGRLSVDGTEWTAWTYTNAEGRCLEIDAGSGSINTCGSPGSFTSGVGGLEVGDTWYVVLHGFAPAAAASAQAELKDGVEVSAKQSFVGRGVWFLVYPATATDPADDPATVEILNNAGEVIDTATPPSLSAAVNATQAASSGG